MVDPDDKLVERYSRILPQLDEEPKSLETFIRKADTLFNLLKNDNAKNIFLNCVKDSTTESTYADIASLKTWEEIKQELKVIILPRKTISQLHNDLQNVVKDPLDTIVGFSEKIKKAMNGLKNAHRLSDRTVLEADWKRVFDIIETQALTTFIQGLSPQLRNWIMAKDFKTLKEAENHARTLEYLDKESIPAITDSNQTYQDSKPINKSFKMCFKCHRMGHTADRCFSANIPRINFSGLPIDTYYKPQNINPIRDNFISPNAQSHGYIYQRQELLCTHCGGRNHNKESCYRLQSAVKCTYCGKAGHEIANCLRKISDLPHQPEINHIYYDNYPQVPLGIQPDYDI